MVGIDFVLKQMIIMIPAHFRERARKRCFPASSVELIAAPAGSKTEVIMKLVSPTEF